VEVGRGEKMKGNFVDLDVDLAAAWRIVALKISLCKV
jgi:hypothetical protein